LRSLLDSGGKSYWMCGIDAGFVGSGMNSDTGWCSVTLFKRMASLRTVVSFLEIGFGSRR
jgi:hypothetical protein